MAVESPDGVEHRLDNCPSTDSEGLSNAELKNLRRVADNLPRRVWVIAIIGFWERFTFWGLTAPWQNYMANDPRVDVRPGKLGLGQATATRIYCGFYIFYYVTPIFVAILSDARLGRFKTLCISTILFFIGSAVLAVTSHPWLLELKAGLPGLIVAMVLIGLGGGGFRAIIVPFIADQYPKSPPRLAVLKSGEQVVVDHTLTLGYIYTMYYWVGNVGSLSWFATTYMEKYFDGFWPAYALTCCSMTVTMLLLLFGSSWYVKVPQEGNVLPQATKILLCAAKSGFNVKRALPEQQLESHARHVSWNAHLVDELRRALRACRVLIAFVVFYVCFDQMQNNLISQAGQMKTKWMPNDAMPALNQVAIIVFGPIIHHFYIFLHKRKIYLRPIARITIGFAFTSLSMAYATCVQGMIYRAPPCHRYPLLCNVRGTWLVGPNEVNVWVQAPVYVLLAIGEIFGLVTALEYSYEHSPKEMKAVIQAISLLIAGLGSVCAMALTPVAKDPHLMILYASLFGVMTLTTIVFGLVFRGYDKNYIADGGEGTDVHADSKKDDVLTNNHDLRVLRVLSKTASPRSSRDMHDEADFALDHIANTMEGTAEVATGLEPSGGRPRRSTHANSEVAQGVLQRPAPDQPDLGVSTTVDNSGPPNICSLNSSRQADPALGSSRQLTAPRVAPAAKLARLNTDILIPTTHALFPATAPDTLLYERSLESAISLPEPVSEYCTPLSSNTSGDHEKSTYSVPAPIPRTLHVDGQRLKLVPGLTSYDRPAASYNIPISDDTILEIAFTSTEQSGSCSNAGSSTEDEIFADTFLDDAKVSTSSFATAPVQENESSGAGPEKFRNAPADVSSVELE